MEHSNKKPFSLTWIGGSIDLHRHIDTGSSVRWDAHRQVLFTFCGTKKKQNSHDKTDQFLVAPATPANTLEETHPGHCWLWGPWGWSVRRGPGGSAAAPAAWDAAAPPPAASFSSPARWRRSRPRRCAPASPLGAPTWQPVPAAAAREPEPWAVRWKAPGREPHLEKGGKRKWG